MRFVGTRRAAMNKSRRPTSRPSACRSTSVPLRAAQGIELGGGIFNVLNAGDYTQYNYSGANERFNPNFLQMRNQQPARAFQATVVYRF